MELKPTPRFCVRCGTPIKPGEKFCMNCGAQLVKNLYDKTPIEPTKIEPTEVKPTEIEPTKIEPTKIEPTEIKPTEIKSTNIEPTPIEPTPIEPTPIVPGVFNNRFFMFFIKPNIFIWGLIALVSTVFFMFSVGLGGFNWWNVFPLLLMLGSLFEVVWGIVKAPANKFNPDGTKRSFGHQLGDKMTYLVKGENKDKPTPKNLVGTIAGGVAAISLVFFLLISMFSGFQNFVVVDGYTFRYSRESYGYNPETDYELVTFYPGFKACDQIYDKGELIFQVSGSYARAGDTLNLRCKNLEVGTWMTVGSDSTWGVTTAFKIKSYKHLQSGSAHFYRTK